MSSGFVSGGTTDQPIERDDEWLKAQREIDATRRRKEEESRQEGGKTLYEVLQNNKGDYVKHSFGSSLHEWHRLTCQVRCARGSCQAGSFRRVHTTKKPISKPG